MDAAKLAKTLKRSISKPKQALTIADASTLSGLSFNQAERGLMALVAEFRGELIPTEKGELLFRFPTGFRKPWEKKEAASAFWTKTKALALGVAKFVVRAWITIVMVAYVAIFAAILIGLAFSQRSSRDNRGSSFGSFGMLHVLLRVVLDSLFWTFHPFSPFRVGYSGYSRPRRRDSGEAFYEKVNRFFFGPEEEPEDPMLPKKRVLEEIRAQKGRIALLDVLRVTGMTREAADPFLAKLMLEYDGDVHVSDFGGITYSFPELRKTAGHVLSSQVKSPRWLKRKVLMPFTGNESGSNILVAGLNGFNLFMSLVAIDNGWTVEGLRHMFAGVPPELIPNTGAALLLGWIPFWFSLALFAIPVMRWLARPGKQREVNRDNGRRGMLWAVLSRLTPRGISEFILKNGWEQLAGITPTHRQVDKEVIKLGGELDLNMQTGQTAYRFKNLELEVQALEKERTKASHTEADIGARVEF
ncbi:MAG: hypothetical protein JKY15_07695 [Deltaproteobacteria bacterium]|nr:hypothetical protein [Deltaproteobacteria bacterium]